ncbi:MAG TPA: hypothetical protein VEL28_14010 [Candidatus Binatia bacterium]|nr:hypothetical protein [Candidatus Binatia bacterium]
MIGRKRLAILSMLLAITSPCYAGTCYIDGEDYASSQIAPVETDDNPTLNGGLCGHTIYGTGTGGCIIEVHNDDGVSSGNCLTLGKGVEIRGNGHTLDCSGAACLAAIVEVSVSPPGSGATHVDNLNVTGCFQWGVLGNYSFGKITNSKIDLAGSCSGVTNGIVSMPTVEGVVVTNANGLGIGCDGSTVRDSVIHNSEEGLKVNSSSSIDNVLMYDNTVTLRLISGSPPNMTSSALLGSSCYCKGPSNVCTDDITACVNPTGDPNFTEEVMF